MIAGSKHDSNKGTNMALNRAYWYNAAQNNNDSRLRSFVWEPKGEGRKTRNWAIEQNKTRRQKRNIVVAELIAKEKAEAEAQAQAQARGKAATAPPPKGWFSWWQRSPAVAPTLSSSTQNTTSIAAAVPNRDAVYTELKVFAEHISNSIYENYLELQGTIYSLALHLLKLNTSLERIKSNITFMCDLIKGELTKMVLIDKEIKQKFALNCIKSVDTVITDQFLRNNSENQINTIKSIILDVSASAQAEARAEAEAEAKAVAALAEAEAAAAARAALAEAEAEAAVAKAAVAKAPPIPPLVGVQQPTKWGKPRWRGGRRTNKKRIHAAKKQRTMRR